MWSVVGIGVGPVTRSELGSVCARSRIMFVAHDALCFADRFSQRAVTKLRDVDLRQHVKCFVSVYIL